MIKKLFLLTSVPFLLFSGCTKSDSNSGCSSAESTLVAPAAEIQYIQNYLSANGLTAIQHPSGIFYTVTVPGSGASPTLCSQVTAKYSGYLFSGFKFDENLQGYNSTLSQLIVGWQKGMEMIMKNGSIILYIPPTLGYGNVPKGNIPANSYLKFYIELLNVY